MDAGVAVDAKPSAIGRLNQAREGLHRIVDELEKILAPVLGHDPEAELAQVASEQPHAPMTYLHESAASVEDAASRLRSIMRRLELN